MVSCRTPLAVSLILLAAGLAADPPRKMTLAFSEDFDAPALDTSKWTMVAGLPPGNVRIEGGKLRLGVSRAPSGQWVGGAIVTRNRFEQAQGYFEASVKFGRHQGHHAAFRLVPAQMKPSEKFAELYIAEGFGEDIVITWVRHNDGKALKEEKPRNLKPLPAGAAGSKFVTYGLEWGRRELTWYADGKKIHSLRLETPQEKLFMSLGSTVSEFELPKLDPSKLPDDAEVDWVKAWR